jgi:hypothetical protein
MFCHFLSPLSSVSGENSTKYLNFTASEKTSHVIQHQYQVEIGGHVATERMLGREIDVK